MIAARRLYAFYKSRKYKTIWPIDFSADKKPEWFHGWPQKKRFAVLLRHDIESEVGYRKINDLIDIEDGLGFKSVYNLLFQKYEVTREMIDGIKKRGFEAGIHGLTHDGKLYLSKEIFDKRVKLINHYLEKHQCAGFASPSSFHNLEWLHDLNIEYDSSTFDTDPIEPQNDAVKTIYPFMVKNYRQHSYIEIPYTLPQDFTVFILLKHKDIDLWKRKVDWIAEKGGMVLVNVHPDYLQFHGDKKRINNYPVDFYIEFLDYIKTNYKDQYWHVLPRELASFCRSECIKDLINTSIRMPRNIP
ncbi:MAG: hypothetical protein JW881_03285 [Spirochaetales bacterium]|nr:hypothetical protein [Spirochaetales bacterium]